MKEIEQADIYGFDLVGAEVTKHIVKFSQSAGYITTFVPVEGIEIFVLVSYCGCGFIGTCGFDQRSGTGARDAQHDC